MKVMKNAVTTAVLVGIALVFTTGAALVQAKPPRGETKVRLPEPPTKTVKIALGSEATISEYDITVKLTSVEAGKSATLELLYSGGKNYVGNRHAAGDNSYRFNPLHYGAVADLLSAATVLYRTHRTCDGKLEKTPASNGYEIADLQGYSNYMCRSRFYEQCIMDGSFDSFYDERCDFAPVRFAVGSAKGAGGFEIKLTQAEAGFATVEVRSTLKDRWGPVFSENPSPTDAKSPSRVTKPSDGIAPERAKLPPERAVRSASASVAQADVPARAVSEQAARQVIAHRLAMNPQNDFERWQADMWGFHAVDCARAAGLELPLLSRTLGL